jgi:phospholipase/lecithinase/hemolysin
VTSRANSLVAAIATLKSAGARIFVVANLPSSFPVNDATQQQLRSLYNQTLFSGLTSHAVAVIQADINSVRVAINNNPAQYGFTSTSTAAGNTACTAPSGVTTAWALLCSSNPNSPSTFASSAADMTHLFAGGPNPVCRIYGNANINPATSPRISRPLPAAGRAKVW